MASPFSFHCMICIEEFSPHERWPVVLPCGHTYVCNQCAERLSKCMECREPLLIPDYSSAPASRPNVAAMPDWRSSRSSRVAAPVAQQPTPPPPKKRLPLPKNVVLMSLMEATEVIANSPADDIPSMLPPAISSPTDNEGNIVLDEEEEEEEKIRQSTSLVASACGTYVVTIQEGAQIFPFQPKDDNDERKMSSQNENEDVDAMVRFFYLDNKIALAKSPDDAKTDLPPVELSKGDRIQIVSIDDGWAKLARGYGYVRAEGGMVAKVGGPVDKACKLEALLRSITVRRKQLRKEQRKVDSQFVHLMSDLQNSLLHDEDLTVIGGDTFETMDNSTIGLNEVPQPFARKERTVSFNDDDNVDDHSLADVVKPHTMRAESPPNIVPTSSLGCFSPSLFGGCNGYDLQRTPSISGCVGPGTVLEGIIGALSFAEDNSVSDANNASWRVLSHDSHPSPRAMSAGARAWRERHNLKASRNIDFRTGMSGHMALLSSHVGAPPAAPNPHEYVRTNTSMLGRMSSHTGLTFRAPKRPSMQHARNEIPSVGTTLSYNSAPKEHDYDDSQTV